jgi:hypothetical protein
VVQEPSDTNTPPWPPAPLTSISQNS